MAARSVPFMSLQLVSLPSVSQPVVPSPVADMPVDPVDAVPDVIPETIVVTMALEPEEDELALESEKKVLRKRKGLFFSFFVCRYIMAFSML